MDTIVAFAVSSLEMAEDALDQLQDVVTDNAVVFRDDRGHLLVQQTSDLSEDPAEWPRLLAAVVEPIVPRSAGAAPGTDAHHTEAMAEEVLELITDATVAGAAVLLLLHEATADAVEAAVRRAGIDRVSRCHVGTIGITGDGG